MERTRKGQRKGGGKDKERTATRQRQDSERAAERQTFQSAPFRLSASTNTASFDSKCSGVQHLAVGEEFCHSTAPPSPSSRCFNSDGESAPAKWQSRRRRPRGAALCQLAVERAEGVGLEVLGAVAHPGAVARPDHLGVQPEQRRRRRLPAAALLRPAEGEGRACLAL